MCDVGESIVEVNVFRRVGTAGDEEERIYVEVGCMSANARVEPRKEFCHGGVVCDEFCRHHLL